jgi:hypothetical protein
MILGEGGYSIVYKGFINNDVRWAVKKAKLDSKNSI